MAILGEEIKRLAASGMTPDQIALVADILQEREEKKKAKTRERVQRHRDMKRNVTLRNVTPPNGFPPHPLSLTPELHTAPARTREEASPEPVTSFQQVFDAGCEVFPELLTRSTAVIHVWLQAGCDPERDIIPEIRRHAGKAIKSWGYFTGSVMDAHKTRTTAPPEGKARDGPAKPGSSWQPGIEHKPPEYEDEILQEIKGKRVNAG